MAAAALLAILLKKLLYSGNFPFM
jgi:hypothetical protein